MSPSNQLACRYIEKVDGKDQYEYRCTVSAIEKNTRREAVVEGIGPKATDALRDAIDKLEASGGEWQVTCISTPGTIYADLQGRKPQKAGTRARWPEYDMLRSIRRLDLAPPLRSTVGRQGLPRASRSKYTQGRDAA